MLSIGAYDYYLINLFSSKSTETSPESLQAGKGAAMTTYTEKGGMVCERLAAFD